MIGQEREKTFLDYLRVVFDRMWMIIGIIILTEVFIFTYNIVVRPKYKSVVKLSIFGEKDREIPLLKDVFSWRMDITRSQSEVIKSDKNIREVVKALNLDTRQKPKDFTSFIKKVIESISDLYDNVEGFFCTKILRKEYSKPVKLVGVEKETDRIKRRRLIKVAMLPETNLIEIKTTDYNPVVSANMANAVALVYIIQDMKNQLADLSRIYKHKYPKIIELKKNIDETREKLLKLPESWEYDINIPSNIKIAELAIPANKPALPKKMMNLLLGLLLSIISGLVLAFTLEYLEQTIKTPDALEASVGAPVLGSMRKFTKQEIIKKGYLQPRENFADLSKAVFARVKKDNLKSLLITSVNPKEGKSMLAYNLAVGLALDMEMSICLVDFNFSNPKVHVLTGNQNQAGVYELLNSNADLDAVLKKCGIKNLKTVTIGNPPADSGVFLHHDKVRGVIDALSAKADLIIIDCASYKQCPDIVSISQEIDGLFLVVHAGETRKPALERFRDMLIEHNAKIVGAALTFREYKIPAAIYKMV